MKNYLTMLLLLLLPAFSFAQEDYESKEREKYYDKNKRFKSFEPVNKEIVSNYYDDFFKFAKVDNYTPYNDTLVFTPYQDSVEFHSVARQYIGDIDRFSILKHEKKGKVEAFIYYDFKYVETFTGEPEIWVAYSDDNGKSWSHYYSGIVQKQPLFVKWYSSYPLINEQGDLQIEACLLRQMSSFIMPLAGFIIGNRFFQHRNGFGKSCPNRRIASLILRHAGSFDSSIHITNMMATVPR